MIFDRIHNKIFEAEREDIHESFEDEIMRKPIYDEEYVGVEFREVYKKEGRRDPIYDHENVPDEPLYDE